MTSKVGKRPLRSLSAHEKMEAIRRVHDGESKASVARDIGVPESTLRGWCKNEDKILYLSRQSTPDTDDSDHLQPPRDKKPRFETTDIAAMQPYNLSVRAASKSPPPAPPVDTVDPIVEAEPAATALNLTKQDSPKSAGNISERERERNRAELTRLSIELGLNRPEMFLPSSASIAANLTDLSATLSANLGLVAQWNNALFQHVTVNPTTNSAVPKKRPTTTLDTTAQQTPQPTQLPQQQPQQLQPVVTTSAGTTTINNQINHNNNNNNNNNNNSQNAKSATKVKKQLTENNVDDSVWYWLKTQQAMLGLVQNSSNQNVVDPNSSWFWKWYKQLAYGQQLQPQLSQQQQQLGESPEKPILYQQLTKDVVTNSENINKSDESPKPAKTNNNNNNSTTKVRAVLDNLLLNNNNDESSVSNNGTDTSADPKKETSDVKSAEEAVSTPASAAEALSHGEKFLRWLERGGDPSVTAVQILQFRYLLNNVRTGADRKNGSELHKTKPERILSPATVFARQSGNAFEMATGLCSLLLEAGYNAYVVAGYATQDITENIRIRTECPVKTEKYEEEVVKEEAMESKYELRSIRDLRSKFLLYMVQREIDKVEEKRQKQLEKERLEREEREKAPPDDLQGWRVHAWILMLPKKDVTEPFFIEPSTGVSYPVSTDVYISLESLWNTENYWVNLQDCTNGLGNLNFDLTEVSCWEHIFIGEPIDTRKIFIDPEADVDENLAPDEKHLDVPTPWGEPINISHEALKVRYPNGVKTVKYKRVILQQYGEYVQFDGLKHRINIFEDFECTILKTVEDTYENKQDCLQTFCTDIETNIVTEYFRRGREDACKKHVFNFKTNVLEAPRTMEFYNDFRLDGLQKLEMNPLFLKETFKNREDKLCFRHTEFAPRGSPPPGMIEGARRIVVSITEKFERDPSKDADDDIAIREFAEVDNEIRLKYHYAKGHVTASTRDFVKPNVAEMGESLTFNPELTSGYQAKIGAKPPRQLQLFYLLEAQLQYEQKALYHLREIEDEITTFIRTRAIEGAVPQLNVSLFNREQNEEYKVGLKERQQQQRQQQERAIDVDIDYLAPYIVRCGVKGKLNKTQALAVRDECLKEFRQLLVTRSEVLRQKFEREYTKFLERQQWFSTHASGLNVLEEETELNALASTKYVLQMYDVRLQRYRELSAFRYRNLETYLNLDKRLTAMHHKK